MVNLYWLSLCLVAGSLLGVIFFGGLWLTVQKIPTSTHPIRLVLLSLVTRISLTLAGFYGLTQGHWQNLAACLVGFGVARLWVTYFTQGRRLPKRATSGEPHALKP